MKIWTTPNGKKLTLKQFIQRWLWGIKKVPIVKKMNKMEGILK